MSIDELDIQSVKVGQKVTVTADAFEGQTFSGTVTNVSLESTYSNGVSTYPVTVTMDEQEICFRYECRWRDHIRRGK